MELHHPVFCHFLGSYCLPKFASASYQHDEEDEESKIKSHFLDLEEIDELKRKTLICKCCRKRKVLNDRVDGILYCSCPSSQFKIENLEEEDGLGWIPFLEQKDVLVWRKPHPKLDGLYAYKMYGRFHDVSPKEFLAAQLDVSESRKSWDTSTVDCKTIKENRIDSVGSTDQVYYWEVAWPKFFANRDYVCKRKVRIDEKYGRIVIYTEAIIHPECPRSDKKFRVDDYVSILTIQSVAGRNMDSKGLEFSLTAFENPGLSLPTSITNWVAMRGLPQYMLNMRRACLENSKINRKISGMDSNRNEDKMAQGNMF
ncbi:phosphatidylcholine transfer protein isoform X2 [Lepeophtheirus salmonis]|uniref:phosphatidylcholine transfer protein isoform X2 n=1 Tax=Lepeophtheirus salmonis TaxID=72036 RepID=UPI001AE5EE8C|nr:stAR-related lipid transfer protein 7, mitochondrial-like isoform X2 [Lepeophtheirus salmonis]